MVVASFGFEVRDKCVGVAAVPVCLELEVGQRSCALAERSRLGMGNGSSSHPNSKPNGEERFTCPEFPFTLNWPTIHFNWPRIDNRRPNCTLRRAFHMCEFIIHGNSYMRVNLIKYIPSVSLATIQYFM